MCVCVFACRDSGSWYDRKYDHKILALNGVNVCVICHFDNICDMLISEYVCASSCEQINHTHNKYIQIPLRNECAKNLTLKIHFLVTFVFSIFFFLSLHSFYTIRRLQFDELVGFMGANRIYEIKLRAQTHEYALKHVPYIEHPNDIRPNEYVCLYEAMTSSELHTFFSCESSCCCDVTVLTRVQYFH